MARTGSGGDGTTAPRSPPSTTTAGGGVSVERCCDVSPRWTTLPCESAGRSLPARYTFGAQAVLPPPSGEMPIVARARVLACVVIAVAMSSACARAPAPRTGAAHATNAMVTDTIWYISARARDDHGRDTRRLADSLEYGIVISAVGNADGQTTDALSANAVSAVALSADALSRDIDLTLVDSVRMTESEFVGALRNRARSAPASADGARDSLVALMVHGFGTGLHEAWDYGTQAHLRARSKAPWVVFCWPSNGSGVAWPRAGEVLVRAYRQDSIAATNSRAAFAASLGTLIDAAGSGQLLVVAHSLGAQIVGETLTADSTLRRRLGEVPLRALAYFAPDVATSRFNDVVLPATMPLARRVAIYASSNDKLLTLSRRINRSERAGLLRGTASPPRGLDLVDVTRGLSAENRIQRLFGSHHALRRATSALFDLLTIVANGVPASCRATLGTASVNARGIWELTAIPPPWHDSIGSCIRHE